jgi:hypothetical protein
MYLYTYLSIIGILICIVGAVFATLAIILNSYENHRTETSYINRLVLKVYIYIQLYICICIYISISISILD